MKRGNSDWESSMGVAKAILDDRLARRKWMARLLFATLAWMAVGLWLVDSWLAENVIRFALWWLFSGFLAIVLLIFSLYDSVAVVKEERAEVSEKQSGKNP